MIGSAAETKPGNNQTPQWLFDRIKLEDNVSKVLMQMNVLQSKLYIKTGQWKQEKHSLQTGGLYLHIPMQITGQGWKNNMAF